MFGLSSTEQYYLLLAGTDMRKSFDGLSGLVSVYSEKLELSQSVFVFINNRRDKMKLLHWRGSGFVLYYKRLEEGTFELPKYDLPNGIIKLSYAQVVMLIDGISIVNIKKRKRYLSTNKC